MSFFDQVDRTVQRDPPSDEWHPPITLLCLDLEACRHLERTRGSFDDLAWLHRCMMKFCLRIWVSCWKWRAISGCEVCPDRRQTRALCPSASQNRLDVAEDICRLSTTNLLDRDIRPMTRPCILAEVGSTIRSSRPGGMPCFEE